MQVVKPVEEVPEVASEQSQDVAVAELTDELDEEVSHLLEELGVGAAKSAEGLLGDPAQQVLWVDLLK